MEAFYDLSKSAATHDYLNWLSRVNDDLPEGESLQIRFVKGHRDSSQRDKFFTKERREWKYQNLLAPLSWLHPAVTDVSYGVGEQVHSYLNPGKVKPPFLKAPKNALDVVSNILPKKAVTITLRDSDFEPLRNTNFGEWIKVAQWLKSNGYSPIFIPDGEAECYGREKEIPFQVYRPASHNFALRLALYELAGMNLFINSGPLLMGMYADVPLMGFKMYVPGVPCCSEKHIRASGFSPDHDWSTQNHPKRLYWEPDSAKNIIPELQKRMPMSLRAA